MTKKYKVTGNFKGEKIEEIVEAVSIKQAKLKAGFSSGFGGREISEFINSRNIKVRRI